MKLYSKQFFLLLLVYATCNFLMLLNTGAFWDDWTVFNMSFEGLKLQWSHNGMIFPMYLYDFLNHLPNPVFWFHLLSFVIGFLIVWQFVKLLEQLHVFNAAQLFYI